MKGSVAQRPAPAPDVGLASAIVLPDYRGGSIVNLMSSVVAACGGSAHTEYPRSALLDIDELSRCRKLVLMVIDGLGHDVLLHHAVGSALHGHLRGAVTSVFPSTTAAAITSFLTGVAPQQHGLTGWFMYFRELAGVYAVLSGKPRCGGVSFSRSGIDPRTVFDTASVFDALPDRGIVVAPRRIAQSDYNLAFLGKASLRCFDSLDEFFLMTAEAIREPSDGRQLIYAYWPDLDSIGHEYGIGSRESQSHLAQIDQRFRRFCRQMSGSDALLVVTADHGMLDTDEERAIELADHPDLAECLVLPLCGERRASYCYVRSERVERFEAYVSRELSYAVDWMASAEFMAQGAFGCGQPHPRLRQRIGDYVLMMKGRYVLSDWLPGENRYHQIGVHGGVSEAEMLVPVVVAAL